MDDALIDAMLGVVMEAGMHAKMFATVGSKRDNTRYNIDSNTA